MYLNLMYRFAQFMPKTLPLLGFLHIKENTLEFAQKHWMKNFSTYNGRIDHFEKSYDVVQKKVRGEKLDINKKVVNEQNEKFSV